MKKAILFGSLFVIIAIPAISLAAGLEGPLIPAGFQNAPGNAYTLCNLRDVANNVISFAVAASVIVATLMFAYGGFLYLTGPSGGEAQIKKAHSVLLNAVVGILIVLLGWLIVNIVLSVLTNGSVEFWTTFTCEANPVTAAFPGAPTVPPAPADVAPVQPSPSGGPVSTDGRYCHNPAINAATTQAVQNYGPALLGGKPGTGGTGPTDIGLFCPKYATLNINQREAVWASFVNSIAPLESSCDPSPKPYVEPGMGIDPVTHEHVESAGLMQLSYQDELSYRGKVPAGVCDFNYAADSLLLKNDPRRTINNLQGNVNCSMAILNYQVSTHQYSLVTYLDSHGHAGGFYWHIPIRQPKIAADLKKYVPACY